MRAWHPAARRGRRAVVVVHGLGAASSLQLPVAARLAAEFDVFVPDLPGYGRSEAARVLTLTEQADALACWIQAAGVGRAALLGNSMGCQVLLHLADRHAARVDRLVLQGPTVDAGARSAARQVGRFLRDARYERPSIAPVQVRGAWRAGPRRLYRGLHDALDDRPEDVVARLRCPVMVVRGGRDPIVSDAWARRLAARAADGTLRTVPGAGHTMVYSQALELSRVAAPFLRAGRPGG